MRIGKDLVAAAEPHVTVEAPRALGTGGQFIVVLKGSLRGGAGDAAAARGFRRRWQVSRPSAASQRRASAAPRAAGG